jgi:hypothetical protein
MLKSCLAITTYQQSLLISLNQQFFVQYNIIYITMYLYIHISLFPHLDESQRTCLDTGYIYDQ